MKAKRQARKVPAAVVMDAETEGLLERALEQHRAGELGAAIAGYERVLEKAPGQLDALVNLGTALTAVGRQRSALEHLRLARDKALDLPRVHNDLGVCFLELGLVGEAVGSFQRAAMLAPEAAEPWTNLGRALNEAGREGEAAEVVSRAAMLDPLFAPAWLELWRALFREKESRSVVEVFTRAVAADPELYFARYLLGVCLDLTSDKKTALEQFRMLKERGNVMAGAVDSFGYYKAKREPSTRMFMSTRQTLVYALSQARVVGLNLEFGVRFGGSARIFCEVNPDAVLHGFDSFEGLPEQWHIRAPGTYTTHGELPELSEKVELHVGLFGDTLPVFLGSHAESVRFINVDCDLYSSTKTALDLVSDRIVPGTVIVFDEYFVNDRWREDEYKAFQEWATARDVKYRYLAVSLLTGQAVVEILPSGE
ncbi:MAG: tetratricopeptide repeat protein [Polyangiaceae bacterium]|nr:tetratricopeptide repeat protein [Polyangiaceae bacterium]